MDDGQHYKIDILEGLRQCLPANPRSEVHLILACRQLALEVVDKALAYIIARQYRVRIIASEFKEIKPLEGKK